MAFIEAGIEASRMSIENELATLTVMVSTDHVLDAMWREEDVVYADLRDCFVAGDREGVAECARLLSVYQARVDDFAAFSLARL